MTSKRYYYVLIALFVLLAGSIVAGAVGGNILIQKQSEKLTALKVENGSIELQQAALTQAKKDIERYGELDKIARSVVPQDKDQAKTVREIVQIAKENNIPIKSISFETSKLGEKAPKAAPTAEGDSPVAKPVQPSDSQVKPVVGINGVFTLPIQIESAGLVSYQDLLKFLDSLEKNRRTAHVDKINLEPEENGDKLTFNLTLNAYVKP